MDCRYMKKYHEPTDGTDGTLVAGYAHMLIYDAQRRVFANATLTETGDIEYHTGPSCSVAA